MNVEVTRYRKPDGFTTRHWAVLVNGELLVVTLFRKGAEAVAQLIATLVMANKSETSQSQPGDTPVTLRDQSDSGPANVEPVPPDGLMLPLLESKAARRKRRRKGLRREILGEASLLNLNTTMENETTESKFQLGQLLATPNALSKIANEDIQTALSRHLDADWGDVCPEDWKANDQALKSGTRLLSAYRSTEGEKFWIITEADRSVTTVLLPEDY